MPDLTQGMSPTEVDRLSRCLDRLMPHVRLDSVAITGGVGMQLGMAVLGRETLRNEIADLDLVAAFIGAIRSTVVGRFLVSHYHVAGPGVPKFMIQLVDPVSQIRVDVFPDVVGSMADARKMTIGEHAVQVLSLERVFEHKVLTLSRASRSAPIDPKHAHDARVLGEVLDRPVPFVDPEALAPDVYGMEVDRSCERCELSRHPSWPLAPKDQIFELLGWNWQPVS
jgi:hypothetical protein